MSKKANKKIDYYALAKSSGVNHQTLRYRYSQGLRGDALVKMPNPKLQRNSITEYVEPKPLKLWPVPRLAEV